MKGVAENLQREGVGFSPGGTVTWMGSWACLLRQGTPRPHQGIFSCRLHSCLGLSVSHTHSVRSTFLSGSLPAPGAGAGAAHGGTHQPTGTCGVPRGGWPLGRKAGPLDPGLWLRRALYCILGLGHAQPAPGKGLDLGRLIVTPLMLCHPHGPSTPLPTHFLHPQPHPGQAVCNLRARTLTHMLTHTHT